MFITNTQSLEFVDSLKTLGVSISNEHQLRERLSEATSWTFALKTLMAHGKALGIQFFTSKKISEKKLHKICEKFSIPLPCENSLKNCLQAC